MRIVNRAEFLKLPRGTVFAKYSPCVVGDLCIKVGNFGNTTDFQYDSIGDQFDRYKLEVGVDEFDAMVAGTEVPVDFNMTSRDGLNDEDQYFAIWSREDVDGLIQRLQESKEEVDRESIQSSGVLTECLEHPSSTN